jgi:hypothetical protein
MCLMTPVAIASDYEIIWFDTSSVGTGTQDNGDYTINGTIGQFAPGRTGETMEYEILGGFWPGVGSTPSCLADLNGDGLLNFFDVSEFLVAYTEEDSIADFNNDGFFNFFDVSGFLVAFKDGCP